MSVENTEGKKGNRWLMAMGISGFWTVFNLLGFMATKSSISLFCGGLCFGIFIAATMNRLQKEGNKDATGSDQPVRDEANSQVRV